MIWLYLAGGLVVALLLALVLLWLVARFSYRLGVSTAHLHRKRLTGPEPAPKRDEEPVPELFTPEEERRRRLLRQQRQKRAGLTPWNWKRPGLTEAEREALSYQLETGALDKTIDTIIREETKR